MRKLAFLSWIAVSSRPQAEKESPKDQREKNNEFVNNLDRYYPGYSGYIVHEIEMVGSRSIAELSDAEARYPREYGEMARLIRSRAIDAIICRARDRLGRTDSLIVTIERLCLEHNIVVVPRQSPPVSLDAQYLRDNAGTGLHAAVDGHMSLFFIRSLVANHKVGTFKRVVEHKKFANMVPFGYRYRYSEDGGQHIEIDPSAAEIVRFILVDCFLQQRLGRLQIVAACNERGYRTKNNLEWSDGSVQNILTMAWRYAGILRVNHTSKTNRVYKEVMGDHPPIITLDEWHEIKTEMESRKPTRISRVRPFAGCVICAKSGKVMSGNATVFKNDDGSSRIHYSYQCNHCEKEHNIAQDRVIAAVRAVLETLDSIDDPASLLPDLEVDTDAIDARIVQIRKELKTIETKKEKLVEIFISSTNISQEIFDRQMDNLDRQEKTLLRAIEDQQELLYQESNREKSIERIIELQQQSVQLLDRISDHPEIVQKFMFRSLRIYVEHDGARGRGGNMRKRTWVSDIVFI